MPCTPRQRERVAGALGSLTSIRDGSATTRAGRQETDSPAAKLQSVGRPSTESQLPRATAGAGGRCPNALETGAARLAWRRWIWAR